jgi:hypothetical protein
MSRWTSSTNETAAAETSVIVTVLVDLDFVSGHVRAHTGLGQLTHASNTYEGLGQFGSIELTPEDSEVAARGAQLVMSGIPGHLVPDVLTESNYQGRAATLYVGLLNQATNAWVDTPEELWSGYMDYMDLNYSGSEARVILYVEDELRREPLQAWYTDEDQQLRYSGDRFFSDLPNVQTHRATWGMKQIKHEFGGGSFLGQVGRAIRQRRRG